MKIDINRIEKLSKIKLETEEKRKFISEMEKIIQWVEEIDRVSEENIRINLNLTPLREDSNIKSEVNRDFFLKNSPESDKEFIIVDEVIKK